MKMKCWPLVVLLAMMAWACGDDDADVTTDNDPEVHEEPETPERKKLVFTITGNVVPSGSSAWMILSDKRGDVLEAAELKNNESHTFEAVEGFAEETVTLTVIRNYTAKYTSVDTYFQVPFGEYGLATTGTGGVVNKVTLTLEGYEGDRLSITNSGPRVPSTYPELFESTDTGAKIGFTTWSQTSKVLIAKNSAPFQYLYGDFEQNTPYTVQMSEIESSDEKDFPWPGDAEIAGWQITGTNSDGDFRYYTTTRQRSLANPEQFVTIPVIPELFTSYSTTLTARTGNVADVYWYKGSETATALKYIDAAFTYAQNGNKFNWETTGTADAVRMQVIATIDGNQSDWRVHGPTGEQEVNVPVIPATVTLSSGNMKRSFAELVESAKSFTTELREYPDYTSYFDVAVEPALVNNTSLTWTEILTQSIEHITQ